MNPIDSDNQAQDAAPAFSTGSAPERRVSRLSYFSKAAVVGVAAGLAAVAFRHSLHLAEVARDDLLTILHQHPAWGWAPLPVIGLLLGLIVGTMTMRWSPEASGSGIPHLKGVLIRVRTLKWKILLPVKFIGSVLGIGAGLSLGREGPTVQMGAAIGQAVGELFRTPKRTMPQLLSCGAGAGLAAAFNAPLAGFIFVLEELQRELSALTYGGALVATVCAASIAALLSGQTPSFAIRGFPALPLTALPLVVVLGVVGGLCGVLFNKSLLRVKMQADRVPSKVRWILPGVAGLLAGIVAWWLPSAVGGGHGEAEQVLRGTMNAAALGLGVLLVVKFLLTVLCYGSGAPGGIFAPMLLMGALLGAIFAKVCAWLFPNWADQYSAFAVLGMAAFFTASVRAPLTAIVLILEMTANQEQLLALCVTCLIAYLVSERLRDRPIYDALLEYDLRRSGLRDADAEPTVVVIGIHRGSHVEGKAIRQVGFPGGCLIVEVERAGRELLPNANLELVAGDHLKVLTPGETPDAALEVVRLCTQHREDPA